MKRDFSVDRKEIGAFIREKRRSLGLTQKELARRLYVSDKAVSKWETGNALPDTGLLLPLADTLGIGVEKLLSGGDPNAGEDRDALVRKVALWQDNADSAVKKRKRIIRCFEVLFFRGIECALYFAFIMGGFKNLGIIGAFSRFYGEVFKSYSFSDITLVLIAGISLPLSALFLPDRLPAYYDENEIKMFSNGFIRLSIGGLNFNNRNWKYILSALFTSILLISLLYLPVCLLLGVFAYAFLPGAFLTRFSHIAFMVKFSAFFCIVFIPAYARGKKYE